MVGGAGSGGLTVHAFVAVTGGTARQGLPSGSRVHRQPVGGESLLHPSSPCVTGAHDGWGGGGQADV
jgi:hypothetical protein